MDLGRVGVWQYQLDQLPSAQSQEVAAEIEELGYGAIWIPEMVGRESFVSSTLLLSGTERIVVATGIAGIYSRDALCANSALHTVTEAFPERFLLGLGVSHQVMVEGMRGHDYSKPYSKMVAYLDAMDNGMFTASPPTTPTHRALAALGPKMLRLAAERTDGAHPYFIPVEHTAFAREQMGADARLYPEQAVVLETDADRAREIARGPHGDVPDAAELHEQPEAVRLDRRGHGRRRHRRPGGTPSSRGVTRPPSPIGWLPTTPPAPTTSASRCSRPNPPRPRWTSGAGSRPRCWAEGLAGCQRRRRGGVDGAAGGGGGGGVGAPGGFPCGGP